MLSGDNQRTVNAIAVQAGVDEAHGDLNALRLLRVQSPA
jgi:cation transport ATPase